ncbi:uncharacterized protein [Rutidosis leptorrhynchoides]|uniref:uncharacterized protein n=1 Tax=Rutidosis leptorrhynchoides TaxID=125765 RepID=UPI003A9A3DC1
MDKDVDIVAKLKLMKGHLRSWISSSRSNESVRFKEIVNKINDIDISIDDGTAGADLISIRNSLVAERDELLKLEDIDSFRKFSIKWDIEGDENSKFFHASLKHKRYSQHIQGLLVDGVWIEDPDVIKDKFFDYYMSKFDAFHTRVEFGHINPHYRLTVNEDELLERDLDDSEIKNAVWDCGSCNIPDNTFPGYQKIFSSGIMHRGANSAFFTLIPKVTNPILVTDFRPISLVGFFYKIVMKILTNRLLSVIDKIINCSDPELL